MSKTDELLALMVDWYGTHGPRPHGAYARQEKFEGIRAAIEQALEDEYDRGFKAAIHAVEAQPHPDPSAQPCIGNDPLCPCQDGLACHYKDAGNTKGWPIP